MSRVLFISDRRPEPGHGAGERTLSIHNALQKIADVDVLLVEIPGQDHQPRPGEGFVRMLDNPARATRWYWRKRAYLLRDFRPDERIASWLSSRHAAQRYDAFFGRYHTPFLAGCSMLGPSFIDVDDMPIDTWSSSVPLFNSIRQAAFTRALARFKTVFVTKQTDAGRVSHPDVRVLPCISTRPDHTGPIKSVGDENRILFVGGAGWPPNREGITWFINNCLPGIRGQVPDAVLRVVGSQGSTVAGPPGVVASDHVPDLLAEYRQAAIVICPIRTGAGAIVKLAEAAAYGLPIVATAFAARGYDGMLQPGRDLLVAESAEEFANACISLLQDRNRRAELSAHARQAAAGRLDQAAIDLAIRNAMTPWMP